MRRIKIGILSNYDFKDYIKLLCSEDNYNKYEFVLIEYPNPEISFDGLVVLNEPKTNFILKCSYQE